MLLPFLALDLLLGRGCSDQQVAYLKDLPADERAGLAMCGVIDVIFVVGRRRRCRLVEGGCHALRRYFPGNSPDLQCSFDDVISSSLVGPALGGAGGMLQCRPAYKHKTSKHRSAAAAQLRT